MSGLARFAFFGAIRAPSILGLLGRQVGQGRFALARPERSISGRTDIVRLLSSARKKKDNTSPAGTFTTVDDVPPPNASLQGDGTTNSADRSEHVTEAFADASVEPPKGSAEEYAQSRVEADIAAGKVQPLPSAGHEAKAGESTRLSFQAETRQILDIVAKSLYTDKEVFLRELVSNASDALEKLRYMQSTNVQTDLPQDYSPEIHILADPQNNSLTIQDTGIGMTRDELITNLGTIARSGSKQFLKDVNSNIKDTGVGSNIIGQFGVGFYSCFMVADRVEVYSRSGLTSEQHYWTSDGSGEFEVAPATDCAVGTKIVLHLKPDASTYADGAVVERVIQKYSNFVGFPIYVNGSKLNTVSAVWTRDKNDVSDADHQEFYKYISNAFDTPTYRLHFTTDSPISIKSIFYFPERHMEKYGMGRMEPGVNLYSRKVLIQPKSKAILPEWLRFVKGVVDSEDIPLNISRENMQDSALIARISDVLTRRLIRFLDEQSRLDPAKYNKWFEEHQTFVKEGVVTDERRKGDIGKLLRYESSVLESGKVTSLDEYVARMPPAQKGIYFLVAPNRTVATNSPYYEAFKNKGVEVLFLYQHIDDFVMKNLAQYAKRKIISIETAEAAAEHKDSTTDKSKDLEPVDADMSAAMVAYFRTVLSDRVSDVRVSERVTSYPAMVVDHESAAVRRMMQYVDQKYAHMLPKQKLEINLRHEVMQKLFSLKESNPPLAKVVAEQVFDNALIAADILDNPQNMLPRLNRLLNELASVGLKASATSPVSPTSESPHSSDPNVRPASGATPSAV